MLKKPKSHYILTKQELEDLLAYQVYKTGDRIYNITFPIVSLCLSVIRNSPDDRQVQIAKHYMIFSFRHLLRKAIFRHHKKITDFRTKSINGSHYDMIDIYQELFLYFFSLIDKYDMSKKVYFVTYLRNYLFWWGRNEFTLNQKEIVEFVYLDGTDTAFSRSSGDNQQIALIDRLVDTSSGNFNGAEVISANSSNKQENSFEDKMISSIILKEFRGYMEENLPKILLIRKKGGVLLFNQVAYDLCLHIYQYFFVEGNRNYSSLSRELNTSSQKIQFYLETLTRLYTQFLTVYKNNTVKYVLARPSKDNSD
jgi:hypothetical protein